MATGNRIGSGIFHCVLASHYYEQEKVMTEKKGRPTVNKENPIETHYSFRKSTNTPAFNTMANARRAHEKFKALARKRNR